MMIRLHGWAAGKAALLTLLLSLPLATAAQDLPRPNDLLVNDYASVMTGAEIAVIRDRLQALKDETGVEMTVLTIHSRADYRSSPSIERFANDIFNSWGIGRAEYNDGILVLMAIADREMRVELGAGYDQGYDVLAQDIVNRWFLPELRAGRPGGAVAEGTRELIERVAKRHAGELDPEPLPFSFTNWFERASGWIFGIIFAAAGLFALAGRKISDWSFRFRRCPSCGKTGLHSAHEPPQHASNPTGEMTKTGRHLITCRHCDWRDERPWQPRMRASRTPGSGGRGGFGGGRSSGGGATGRW